jgi:hypothetical protein
VSTWANPILDIRKILSDGPTDKLRYRKQVMNMPDGTNLVFKTFEMRRVSALAGADGSPIGVFVNGTLATVDSEDLTSGEFKLHTAPTEGQSILATYYVQWFTDAELTEFLIQAAEWIGVADSYATLTEDLRPAAKEFAASVAYQKLAAKFAENLAETYQTFDAPDQKRFDPVSAYMKMSDSKMKRAVQLRDDVYTGRKGQAGAPRSATISGRVRDVPSGR